MSREYPSDAAIDASPFTSWTTFVDSSDAREISLRSYLVAKRVLDLIIAIPALILLSPVMILAALAIKFSDGGPAVFVQTRVGKGGRRFSCWKFRSMVRDAESLKRMLLAQNQHGDHRTFKIRRDPRITWVGRILRKTSIDELPQLWNVVKGDMSIVGPRPPVPSEVDLYSERDRNRLAVQPGMTCLWQVMGAGIFPFSEQVRLDLEYIQTRGLLLDLKLIVRTLPAVLSGRGAY